MPVLERKQVCEHTGKETRVEQFLDHGIIEIVQFLAVDGNVARDRNVLSIRSLAHHLLAGEQTEFLESLTEMRRARDLGIVTPAEVDERLNLRRHFFVVVEKWLLGFFADTLGGPVDDHRVLVVRSRGERERVAADVGRDIGLALPLSLLVDKQVDVVERADDRQW